MTDLPDADDVFRRFFHRWYDDDDRRRRRYPATKPDVEQFPLPLGAHILDGPLDAETRAAAAEQIADMRTAVDGDWPELLAVTGALSVEWIDAFDRAYDEEEVERVLAEAPEGDFDNELVVLACEFGVALGDTLRQRLPELVWVYDWPYWDSAVLDPQSGIKVNVFHWALRKFSDDAADGGYAAMLDAVVDGIRERRVAPLVT